MSELIETEEVLGRKLNTGEVFSIMEKLKKYYGISGSYVPYR